MAYFHLSSAILTGRDRLFCKSTQVNKRKGEEYRLFWSDQPDFVRMAAKLDALIIPFAAVGGDEAFDIAMDSDEILRAPILGDLVRAAAQRYACPSLKRSSPFRPIRAPLLGMHVCNICCCCLGPARTSMWRKLCRR